MKLTFDLPGLFITYGFFLGLSLAVVFLLLRRGNRMANLFLGGLLLVFSMFLLHEILWEQAVYERFPHWLRFTSPLGFLIGPFIYFYVKACTEEEMHLHRKAWLHFTPVLLDAGYTLSFWLLDKADKLDYVQAIERADPPLDLTIAVALKLLVSGLYLGVSIRKVRQYSRHVRDQASNHDRRFTRWLYAFCFSHLTIFALLLIMVVTGWDFHYQILSSLGFLAFVFTVQVTAFTMPEIFYDFPQQMQEPERMRQEQVKYQGSGLTGEQKQEIAQTLEEHMQEARSYLDPELTLAGMAEQVDLPAYQLSQVINEVLGQNFMDFVNQYRVEEAKRRLMDPQYDPFTVLAIAYDVGFNSKSAFYSAFRKFVGKTPTAFRKSLTVRA
jgi:AraC-like DNA-binding protein